jgi:tetratricopeptide (TPR) repeat protein
VNERQDLTPEDGHHLDAAEGWADVGNFDEAMGELEQINPAAQSHLDVLNVRWRVSAEVDRWEDCVKIARKMARAIPDWPLGPVHVALSLHKLGRFKEAIPVLEQAIERFGESLEFLLSLSCCYDGAGDRERANQTVKRTLELFWDNAN